MEKQKFIHSDLSNEKVCIDMSRVVYFGCDDNIGAFGIAPIPVNTEPSFDIDFRLDSDEMISWSFEDKETRNEQYGLLLSKYSSLI